MNISPLYELLIFIENSKEADYQDLKIFSPAILRGVLGKMEAMKLIEKSVQSKFRVSKEGQRTLNLVLDSLHESTRHWDSKWRFVSFSIPESQRSLRDKFRRFLDQLGVKMIMTGLWITPLDQKTIIEKEAKKLEILKNLIIIESENIITGISSEELKNLWDFDKSKMEIYDFIDESEKYLKSKEKSAFETKKLIFKYALILSNQPKLPIELFPADWPQFRANLAYKKIRRLLAQ